MLKTMLKLYGVTAIFVLLFLIGASIVYREPHKKLAGTLTEVPAEIVTVVGYESWYVFENNSTKESVVVPTNKSEVDKLQLKNPVNPTMTGHRFIGAFTKEIYATSSPLLSDNQYHKAGKDTASSTLVKIKLPNEEVKTIKESEL